VADTGLTDGQTPWRVRPNV